MKKLIITLSALLLFAGCSYPNGKYYVSYIYTAQNGEIGTGWVTISRPPILNDKDIRNVEADIALFQDKIDFKSITIINFIKLKP